MLPFGYADLRCVNWLKGILWQESRSRFTSFIQQPVSAVAHIKACEPAAVMGVGVEANRMAPVERQSVVLWRVGTEVMGRFADGSHCLTAQ